ncbi:hypothetical protein [Stieleria neptunia]|nr:hypothetical protein [Stieleria neptunia]
MYSAPRKFDLSTTLVVTTACAMVFAILRAVSLPMIAVAVVAAFFTSIALGQAILFGGKHARVASMLVGAVFFVVAMTFVALRQSNGQSAEDLIPLLFFNAIFGACWGYLGGVLVGSVFMLAEKVRTIINPDRS